MSQEYLALISEIKELENIIEAIPEDNIIERLAFEDRLASARSAIAGLPEQQPLEKARLTFRGRPVAGSHGIAADFGSRAAGAFADAFAAVVAGLNESLRYMGPIPDRAKNRLLITGTAIGSFGFEFELPWKDNDLFSEMNKSDEALEKLQSLLRVSAEGTDDDVTELVEEIHPRAVRKVADFLDYLVQHQAWCGLEFKRDYFRYQGVEQLQFSVERLREENIRERDEEYTGEFQGVLPFSRTFEFKPHDQEGVFKGKVDISIEDPDVLNRDWLHKPVTLKLNVIQVGQGRPRFTLSDISAIRLLSKQ